MQNLSLTRKNGEYILVEKPEVNMDNGILSRETRLDVLKILRLKSELHKKVEHNLKELRKLEGMADAETNIKNYEHIQRSIRYGEAGISMQKTKLLALSERKIAKMFDIPAHKVAYQQRVINGQHL